MADVFKINLNGTEYDITDPTARSAAQTAASDATTALNTANTASTNATTAVNTANAAAAAAATAATTPAISYSNNTLVITTAGG